MADHWSQLTDILNKKYHCTSVFIVVQYLLIVNVLPLFILNCQTMDVHTADPDVDTQAPEPALDDVAAEAACPTATTPEKKRQSVSEKTTAASETGKYDKSRHSNEHKDDIWWEQRGSKANKHLPPKDANSPSPQTGNFLNPTSATIHGSKSKYVEPVPKAAAPTVRAIGQESHLLSPTPASLHGRAHDDTTDPNRKDISPPKLAPVPAQYKDVSSKLFEPTAAIKAATFVKSEKPAVDEREKKWVANTNRGSSISGPVAVDTPPPAPKVSTEKRPPDQSTLLRPTAASKAASIEGAAPPPVPLAAPQERYVNEQYSNIASRLHEETAASKLTQREKAKASTKVFNTGKPSKPAEESKTKHPDKYADVQTRLHESTVAAEANKFKKPEVDETKQKRKSLPPSEPYQSHLLQPTAATTHGAYHKPELVVEEQHRKTKPIRRDSHLLKPTPASLHASVNDPIAPAPVDPPHKPKLEVSSEYQYVQSRLHEDTAAHKNSAYVKKEKPVVDQRETQWVGIASTSPKPEDVSLAPSTDTSNSEYSSVPSRLHQDTAAHKNSVYIKKEVAQPIASKPRRNSKSSATRRDSKPSVEAYTADITAVDDTPAELMSAEVPTDSNVDETVKELTSEVGNEPIPETLMLHSASSEATDTDAAGVAGAVSDDDDKDKCFDIGDLKEGVEQISNELNDNGIRVNGADSADDDQTY